jgi:hypothetical protein
MALGLLQATGIDTA